MEKNQENSADFLLEDHQGQQDPWILFAESKILLGDIFWTSPRGKKLLIHKCASIISKEKRDRINNNRSQFQFELRIDEEYYRETKKLLANLASRSREIQNRLELQKESRDKILKHILPAFWFGQEKHSLFDSVLAWNEQMNQLPSDIELQILDNQEFLYKRSMLIGWSMCIYALLLGYNDYHFLKDLYTVSFLTDLPLVMKGLSTLDIEKMEGNILDWDRGRHALDAYNMAKSYAGIFKFRSVLRMIERHHETKNGDGPVQLTSASLSDLDSIFAHLHHEIGYKHDPFEQLKAEKILAKLIETKKIVSLKERAVTSLGIALRAFEIEDEDYIAVGGL
ncbi:MAG: hypothetical protein Fur0010_14960 [Bdellovibrio sp.]